MKIYISADIEGVAGITHWDEANLNEPTYAQFRAQMTNEVLAACAGAIAAGAGEILIKDAHHTGRNIITAELPECARIIRGWSGHPFSMVQDIDESFDAVLFIGYHSKAGADSNPLAHTLSSTKVASLLINDELASEFLIHAYAASLFGVPIAFLSGDELICREAKSYVADITTVPVSFGLGSSTTSIAPKRALAEIRSGVSSALTGNLSQCRLKLPERFKLEVNYATPVEAYRASWYPGVEQVKPTGVAFETRDYFEVLRAIRFII
jgi:D-amino peptidase